MVKINNDGLKYPKPFLKWAGGKTQLLDEFNRILSSIIKENNIKRYVEPFVGGGALFFYLKRKYEIEESILFDINRELTLAYKTIKMDHKAILDKLDEIENKHLKKSEDKRKEHYYQVRSQYNLQMEDFNYDKFDESWVHRTSYLIFLNKTCFNGLYRQNQKGEFNVPFGRYNNPKIYNEKNIIAVNQALHNTEIYCGDFTQSGNFINKESIVYLDPPYRPLNKTSNFTTYSKNGFGDEDQKKLALFFQQMSQNGAYLMLSNSDPKNYLPTDMFFDELYKNYNISRIPAKRFINCDASKRGELSELIITNF